MADEEEAEGAARKQFVEDFVAKHGEEFRAKIVEWVNGSEAQNLEVQFGRGGSGLARHAEQALFGEGGSAEGITGRTTVEEANENADLRQTRAEREQSEEEPTTLREQDREDQALNERVDAGDSKLEQNELVQLLARMDAQSAPPALVRALGFVPDDDFFDELAAAHQRDTGVDLGAAGIIENLMIDNRDMWTLADLASPGYGRGTVQVPLGGGEFVSVPEDEFDAARDVSALSNVQLRQIITFSGKAGLGEDQWKYIALAAKEQGLTSLVVDEEILDTGNNDFVEDRGGFGTGGRYATNENQQASQRDQERVQTEQLVTEFERNLRKYGRQELAFVATFDQDLAQRAFDDGFLSEADSLKVWDIFDGINKNDLQAFNIDLAGKYWSPMLNPDTALGSQITVTQNDPIALRQTYQDLYSGLYDVQAAPDELDRFISQTEAAITQQGEDQREQTNIYKQGPIQDADALTSLQERTLIDPSARARASIEAVPEFNQLFGKRGGLTPLAYKAQFQNTAANAGLGVTQSQAAVQAGQQTGDPKTTTGRVFFSEEGQASAGIQNRMGRAAQIVARYT